MDDSKAEDGAREERLEVEDRSIGPPFPQRSPRLGSQPSSHLFPYSILLKVHQSQSEPIDQLASRGTVRERADPVGGSGVLELGEFFQECVARFDGVPDGQRVSPPSCDEQEAGPAVPFGPYRSYTMTLW